MSFLPEFISNCCEGEFCYCGKPAIKKIEETIFHDDPNQNRHPYTAYICREHFDEIMGPIKKSPVKLPLSSDPNIHRNKPIVHKTEDEAILIEWIFKDWRIGVTIEKDLQESSWYIVGRHSKIKIPAEGISEYLSKEFLEIIKT